MSKRFDARQIAAISILACACTPKADLGDIEEGTGEETQALDESGEASTGTSTDPTTGAETGDPDTGENPPMPGVGPAAVDVLFVIDNSGSMGEEQGALTASIGGFVTALDTSGLDYRIALTTTDNGNYWCRGSGVSNPEAGNFVYSSCLNRLSDFQFTTDMIDASSACTDYCTADMIATTNGVPWIENGGSNLPAGLATVDALRCALPQGINGCGFESHLESAYLGLRRATMEDENEFGFLRDDAHLMLVFISDELDCSYNKEWETIFLSDAEGGNEVFWTLPDENSPTSGVCWNAGVECSGGPGSYDECHAQDYDFEGNPTTNPDNAVLYPVSRYQDILDDVRATKAASHAQVFVFGILGVPGDYPSTRTIAYADGPNPADPSSFQAKFGIGEGCSSTNGVAVPPVRLRQLAEDNALTGASPLHSICGANYGPALAGMVAQVAAFVGE
jgi:hypothetical protein